MGSHADKLFLVIVRFAINPTFEAGNSKFYPKITGKSSFSVFSIFGTTEPNSMSEVSIFSSF